MSALVPSRDHYLDAEWPGRPGALQVQPEDQLHRLGLDRTEYEPLLDPSAAAFDRLRPATKWRSSTMAEALRHVLLHRAQDVLGVLAARRRAPARTQPVQWTSRWVDSCMWTSRWVDSCIRPKRSGFASNASRSSLARRDLAPCAVHICARIEAKLRPSVELPSVPFTALSMDLSRGGLELRRGRRRSPHLGRIDELAQGVGLATAPDRL